MKCGNCGSKIKKGEPYCPKCGMELFNSQYKPLKKRYLRGEYREVENFVTSPYNLDEDYSKSTHQRYNHQNQGYKQKRKINYQKNYKQERNLQKKHYRGYDLDEYYESKKTNSSIWSTIILLLIVALLIGFVMGLMFFSTKI